MFAIFPVSFLVPAALWGTVLLAIPILVHLFKPRKVRQTPFSSLRWLHLTQHRLSRRIKWHQIFLFILRAAFVTLLVLALARPMYSPAEAGGIAERFIILDVSRSMAYQQGDRPSPLESAKQLAADLLTHQGAGDRTTLLLTGATTQVLGPLVPDATTYLPAIRAVRAGATDTDLSSALQVIRPMLSQRRPDADVALYFITDNHQQSWNQSGIAAFVKDLPAAVTPHVIDVGTPAPQNAWIADASLVRLGNPARRVLRVQVGCVGDTGQERTIHVDGLRSIPERTQTVTLGPGHPAKVDFELPAEYDLADKIAHVRLEPPDGLPSDDHFFANLDTRGALRVLLVDPETSPVASLRTGFHLRTAVEALASRANAFELVYQAAAALAVTDIASADVVILAEVPELSDPLLTALETRIQSGGGLVLFLGPGIKPSFYNTHLHKTLAPATGLLPVSLSNIAEPDPQYGGLAPLAHVLWTHPLLARLFDPVLGDLAQTRFRSFYRFGSPLPDSARALAWIDDSVPAIVEHATGAGKVILFNTTANDAWSDLPRRKSYVPLIDRLLAYLSGGGARRTFEVGETVILPLPDWQAAEQVSIVAPGGDRIIPELNTITGRTTLHLEAVAEPGIYRVERTGSSGKGFAFVVQVGRGDSVLTPLDAATLKKWWEPVGCDILSPDLLRADMIARPGGYPLWSALVALAGLCFVAEMFFVHWLCPRVNPGPVASVIHKRRILSASSQREHKG
jgi:hypothetical protein